MLNISGAFDEVVDLRLLEQEAVLLISSGNYAIALDEGSLISWDHGVYGDEGGVSLGFKLHNPGGKDTLSGKRIRVPKKRDLGDMMASANAIAVKLPDEITDLRSLIVLTMAFIDNEGQIGNAGIFKPKFRVSGILANDLKTAFEKTSSGEKASPYAIDYSDHVNVAQQALNQALMTISAVCIQASYFLREQDASGVLHFERAPASLPSGKHAKLQ